MIVYLDLVLITNFFVCFVFVCLVDKLNVEKTKPLKAILASLVSACLIFVYLLDYTIFVVVKIIGGVIISLIAFWGSRISNFIIKCLSLYIVNFFFIGVLSSYKIDKYYLFYILLMITFAIFIIQNHKKSYIIRNVNSYNVEVFFNNQAIKVEAMCDSGNLCEYKSRPIIYLDNKYYCNTFKKSATTFVETISGIDLISLYRPSSVIINGKECDCYIAFTKLNNVDCLINLLIF